MHGLSIEAQLAALREWAGDQSVGEYIDAGVSARIPIKKRPELQRLLRDVKQGKIDLIAFVKLDRWTRNIREYYKAQDILDAHSVAWRAIHEDYETQTAAGRLKVNIMLAVAQDEADRTSERVKAVFAEKRRKGLVPTGVVPIGLKVENGKAVPNEDSEKVKNAFQYYIATRSVYSLACASQEILGRGYTSQGIRSLLSNERYLSAGVISPEEWEKAQEILSVRSVRHTKTNRTFLFSGLIRCPSCGARMTARGYKAWNKEYIYYSCPRANKAALCEYKHHVREDALENYLLKKIVSVVAGYNLEISKKTKRVDTASIKRKLDKLTDLYINDQIDKDDYDARSAPLRDALRSARSDPKPIEMEQIVDAVDVYPTLSKTSQKAFWSALIQNIVPEDDDSFDILLL